MAFFSRRPALTRVEPTFSNASPENPSTSLSNPDVWLMDAFGATGNPGPPVTERSAMTVSAVFACVKLLSGFIAGLPLKVYQDSPALGQVEAPDHPLATLLALNPNPKGGKLTSFRWRELWAINVLLWGNHYSIVRYNNAGRVMGFQPIMPWCVEVLTTNGSIVGYRVNHVNGDRETIVPDEMLHFAGPGFDGIRGYPRLSYMRNAVSLGLTLEAQTATVHENAAKPSGQLSIDKTLDAAAKKRQIAHFTNVNTGRHNAGKTFFVDGESKFTPFQMSPEDLNTLESRRYQTADICRFYGVSPGMIGEAAGTSSWGTGIEQNNLAFKIYTLEPELQQYEHELNNTLPLRWRGLDYYVQFDRHALLAMDALTAAQVAQTEVAAGLLTPAEYRTRKSRPMIKGSDQLFMNATNKTLEQTINPPVPPAPVTPAAPAPKKEPDPNAP